MHDFELERAESGRRVGSELIEKQNRDTDAMLDQGLYQRLSDYILERDVSGSYFMYSPIASLREKIEERLAEQKQTRIDGPLGVVTAVKNLSSHGIVGT